MTFDEYQKESLKTAPADLPMHVAALGVAGEAGEVADEVKKVLEGRKVLNPLSIMLELGDVLYYVARMADALGVTLDDVAAANLEKIKARFPERFL